MYGVKYHCKVHIFTVVNALTKRFATGNVEIVLKDRFKFEKSWISTPTKKLKILREKKENILRWGIFRNIRKILLQFKFWEKRKNIFSNEIYFRTLKKISEI